MMLFIVMAIVYGYIFYYLLIDKAVCWLMNGSEFPDQIPFALNDNDAVECRSHYIRESYQIHELWMWEMFNYIVLLIN